MRPAVAFAPLYHFVRLIPYKCERTHLLIRIHTLLDHWHDGILTNRIAAYIYAVKVTTAARHVERLVVAEPDIGHVMHRTLLMLAGTITHRQRLILETVSLYLFT